MHSKKIISAIAFSVVSAAALTACGGGGGSSGNTAERYDVTVTAHPNVLPDENGSYQSFVHVRVLEQNDPAPTSQVGCMLDGESLRLGYLYYLDDEGEDGKGPQAYQTVTGETNSGGFSFGFVAIAGPGIAHVTCSVTDPRDSTVRSHYVDIQIN